MSETIFNQRLEFTDRSRETSFKHLPLALFFSILIHFILFLILSSSKASHGIVAPDIIHVSLEPSRDKRSQIVTPQTTEEQKPIVDTQLRAERDSRAERESIKRGDAPDAGAAPKQQQQPRVAPAQRAPQQRAHEQNDREQESAPIKKTPSLMLDEATMQKQFAQPPKKQRSTVMESYQAFSRPPGSGAQILGTTGSADYLPTLPDGDITYLNAKAEKFAVFVRRVALQVFGSLRQSGWERLSSGDIHAIADFTTVRAILSKEGALKEVILEGPSGSFRFDTLLKDAVSQSARDPHPPVQALLPDGTIRFIFQAKSWSRTAVDPRSGFPAEQRWILLGTGLE